MTPGATRPLREPWPLSQLLDLDPSAPQERLESLDQVADHVSGSLQEESCVSS